MAWMSLNEGRWIYWTKETTDDIYGCSEGGYVEVWRNRGGC